MEGMHAEELEESLTANLDLKNALFLAFTLTSRDGGISPAHALLRTGTFASSRSR